MEQLKTRSKRETTASRFRTILFSLVLVCPVFCFAQDMTEITGRVIDKEKNEALVGVSVVVKGSFTGTVTDVNGDFALKTKAKPPLTLVASYIGYQGTEFEVNENAPVNIQLSSNTKLSEVVINARRRQETAQEVPIPITVVGAAQIEQTGAFNVNRVKELIPSVQLYASNPRNTTLNIRGLGSTFGLTNDGIDPGVGFYVDGVYYARPAATALDFIDVERIEVLRGPQGTLFGKNTTSGAFNITTRPASFTPGGAFELSFGNLGFIQGKASITGPLVKDKLAARVAFSGTQRNGTIHNIRTDKYINDINNLGFKASLLYTPTEKVSITLTGDYTAQNPDGYAQVYAGTVKTKRADYRQFSNIIADLGYTLPSENPFDRVVDHDTPWKSGNDFGGVSLNVDAKIGPGTFTSTTAWRNWNWDPSNDRDFTGLSVLAKSQATSVHNQYSQEFRYAGDISKRLSGVVGVHALYQEVKSNPVQIEEAGPDQWRFSQSTNHAAWSTPGLLEGYGIKTTNSLKSFTGALFTQVDWNIVGGLHLLPGIRLNYDQKDVDYERTTYGGLDVTDSASVAIKRAVYTNQAFTTDVNEFTPSGQVTLSYIFSKKANIYATYALSYKPIGVNLGGLPTIPSGQPNAGQPNIALAEVASERVHHYEVGVKTNFTSNFTLNLTGFYTDVHDYQTNVQSPELGVNRGYLANAERVRVLGAELDANLKLNRFFAVFGSLAFTDGKYVKFENAPLPLEETGSTQDGKQLAFKDISGGELPGISKVAFSVGAEVSSNPVKFLRQDGRFFLSFDSYYRTDFSSSPSPSQFLNIDGYGLLNARVGYKTADGLSFFVWGRNLTNKDYFEQLLVAGGNAGQYAAVLGDPITFGGTVRYTF